MHPSSIVHSLVRFRDGAALAHLGYPDMTVPISYALTYPERAASRGPAARPRRRADARVLRARPRDVPAARSRAPRGRARRHVPVRVQRRKRGRRRRVPRRAAALPRDRGGRRGRAAAADGSAARDLAELVEADAEARRLAGERRARRMSIFISILGLGFLILIHEAGHFFVARGGGDESAQVLSRLPAGAREDEAQRDRVRRRRDPARRLRQDPRHASPGGGRPGHPLRPGGRGAAVARAVRWSCCASASRRATTRVRGSAVTNLAEAMHGAQLSPRRAKAAERGLTDVDDALAPDAYWRAKTWKRVAVIFAGPGANLLLAVVLFAVLFMAGGGQATRTRRRGPSSRLPAAAIGPAARATRSSRSTGSRSLADEIARVDLRLRRPPARGHGGARRRHGPARADQAGEDRRQLPPRLCARR